MEEPAMRTVTLVLVHVHAACFGLSVGLVLVGSEELWVLNFAAGVVHFVLGCLWMDLRRRYYSTS